MKPEDLKPDGTIVIICYSDDQTDKVLAIMEKEGLKWRQGQKATEYRPPFRYPNQIVYDSNLCCGQGKDNTKLQLSAKEFIALKNSTETTLFQPKEKKIQPLNW